MRHSMYERVVRDGDPMVTAAGVRTKFWLGVLSGLLLAWAWPAAAATALGPNWQRDEAGAFAVAEREQGNLRPVEELLDHQRPGER